MFIKILVCILAGLGAGVGTGLAGLSAAAVISPLLIVCLDMDPYLAVGISLASDVLASGVSSITYAKNKNIDLKHGFIMLISVLLFTFIGSLLANYIPSNTMGNFSIYMTIILGIKFIVKPAINPKESSLLKSEKRKIVESIIFGTLIGLICGFIGAGGGLMMLMVLITILGYDLKKAVGTSVFVMTFTALTGAISHFAIGGMPDMLCLVVCMISTLLFAQLSAMFANKSDAKLVNRITGIMLVILGIILFILNLF